MKLYEGDAGKTSGLVMLPKLKYEHVQLSNMRVELAAQVVQSYKANHKNH